MPSDIMVFVAAYTNYGKSIKDIADILYNSILDYSTGKDVNTVTIEFNKKYNRCGVIAPNEVIRNQLRKLEKHGKVARTKQTKSKYLYKKI